MSRILLVDDDTLLTELLTEYLSAEGLTVHSVHDGEAGVDEILSGQPYDVVVLDSMMPKMNGLDVLKTVRAQSKVPVVMLTAKGDDIDRIIGLEMGADDYVPKPCQPRELLARINAILRRTQNQSDTNTPNVVSVSGVTLFPAKRQATIGEAALELTSTEFNLLEVLMRHAGQVVSKETLSLEALDRKLAKFDRSIDVHISSIRHKLGDASLIQTVRGLGYLFVKS